MGPIRVHFGPMPAMLRAIVEDLLAQEQDIEVVGTSTQADECLIAARQEHAAIIVTQDKEQRGSACLDLILANPPLGVVSVSTDGRSAAGVSLVRRPITFDSESPTVLADAIRLIAAGLSTAPDNPVSAHGGTGQGAIDPALQSAQHGGGSS